MPTVRPSFRVEIACGTDELGDSLVQTCTDAGYRVEKVDDSGFGEDLRAWVSPVATTERVLTIWEVPVLEPGWAERLGRRAVATGPIIGLMGFAERSTVTLAKANGACACLELPCDRDDLLEVIDRVTRSIPLGKVAVATARRTAPCTSATLATTRCRAAELAPRRTIVVVRSATAVYNCLKLTGSWATMRKSSLSRRQESRPEADGPTESVAAVPILALKDLTRAVQARDRISGARGRIEERPKRERLTEPGARRRH